MDQIEVRGGSEHLRISQAFTKPAEVIASAEGLLGIWKAGRPQGNPDFTTGKGPISIGAVLPADICRTPLHARRRSNAVRLPNCGAQYKLVRVETNEMLRDQQLACRKCGGPLRGRQGRFVLKYFLVDRPGRRALGRR